MTTKIQVNFRFNKYSEVLVIVSYKFSQFLHYILCLQGQGIHCWHSYWATRFRWNRKSMSTSGSKEVPYWWFCLINFWIFFTIYVFEVKESIADIPSELPCLGDLNNLDQIPIQEWLRGRVANFQEVSGSFRESFRKLGKFPQQSFRKVSGKIWKFRKKEVRKK